MNNNAYKSSAPAAGSAKHLSRVETAPRRDPRIRTTGAAPVSEAPLEAPEQAPKKKSRWWIWVIVALLVLAAAAAVYFLFFRPDTPEPVEEVLVYGLQDPLIFENEECAFMIDAIGEKGDFLELDVRCVNKTDDILSFTWDSTCVNGSMFDPLWSVYVQAQSTMKSSITFPLSTLSSYNLLPANQIKFVMNVHNETQYQNLLLESSMYITSYADLPDRYDKDDYQKIKGYSGYLFDKDVKVDEDGRPYYVREIDEDTKKDEDNAEGEDKKEPENIYFDEIFDRTGLPVYPSDSDRISLLSFYNDKFGRPYYFNESAETIYYEGYGFAFHDEESGKNYYYDENGEPAWYGNQGIPEYYDGTVSQSLLDAGKPESQAKIDGAYIVHKEFTIYPTGKSAADVVRPERITSNSEVVYWNGEKGNFIVLGGELDTFKGYIVHTYVENNSDNYIYFGWNNVIVNGVYMDPDSTTVLRPHSSAYRDIIIPMEDINNNNLGAVSEIAFRVHAVGENLSVPLYPIEWNTPASGRTNR